jgi:hypothetical protein
VAATTNRPKPHHIQLEPIVSGIARLLRVVVPARPRKQKTSAVVSAEVSLQQVPLPTEPGLVGPD